ncbi:uncharacterized protein EV154DRAFT_519588 [Mucor mucedo]|uniref:uncharacterized protein n=1 Tax=Mucor mucedo TaxID=29922 RepID=UPI00221F8D4E|nr:uncharacterized protein EV154DRAFT_519588 [Mucor mucedo]KAI7887831.1 hypothetical protein EV154DRAFT_519588 [Mucor mucedo]
MDTFPYEILENIASQITTDHQYNALTVCKGWYLPFCRSLYRHIHFTSRHQFKKFMSTSLVQHGSWIRTLHIGIPKSFKWEDCVTGAIPLLPVQVGVTLHELSTLILYLPLLQSLNFDPRLWHFMKTDKIDFPHHIISLPPLDHPRQFRFMHQSLRKLHLRGADIFRCHGDNGLLEALKGMTSLEDLTVDGDGMWDSEHVMQFSMNDMNTLHTYLPRLRRLDMTDSIHFVRTAEEDHTKFENIAIQHSLSSLVLSASVDCLDTWCEYFGWSYPRLSSLNIKLSCRDNKQTLALRRWINKLSHLKHLTIHPSMAKEFMDEKTLDSAKLIQTLETGLWGHDLQTSTDAFHCLSQSTLAQRTTHLVIPIWSAVMDLSACTSLAKLELSCLHRDGQEFAMDVILSSCPVLNHLELSWGNLSSGTYWRKHGHLKTLRMNHVVVQGDHLFHDLSIQCPSLEGLFLRRCGGVHQLDMPGTHFKYMVVSELLIETSIIMTYLKLIQFQKLQQQRQRQAAKQSIARFYKSYQNQTTFQTCIQRLKNEKEHMLSIVCGSVEQLVFNGCRI